MDGVLSAIMRHVENLNSASNLYKAIFAELKWMALKDTMQRQYIVDGSMFDAYCRTTCCGLFAESLVPAPSYLLEFQDVKNTLATFLDSPDIDTTALVLESGVECFFAQVYGSYTGRSFFTTEEGYIGLAPQAAKPGDQICVLIGCNSPVVLRSNGIEQYQVVGECYMDGFMNGEALLGQIPNCFRAVRVQDDDEEIWYDRFLDELNGKAQ